MREGQFYRRTKVTYTSLFRTLRYFSVSWEMLKSLTNVTKFVIFVTLLTGFRMDN
uniref:Uncharacterized protein n=1 Tax=Anguilla anguilla TaxID=7936 RepID=A0A0E9TJW5_ANGAN